MYGDAAPEHQPKSSGYIDSRDGVKLYHEIYEPKGSGRAVVGVVHGYAEHHARYEYLLRYFAERELSIGLFDYRGHGQSGGKRGHCYVFEEFHRDLRAFLEALHRHARGRPVFLFGHSHGALIVLHYALSRGGAIEDVDGLVLSAPWLRLAIQVPAWKIWLGRTVSNFWATFSLPNEISSTAVSRNPDEVRRHSADPVINRQATARWFTEASRAQQEVLAQAGSLETPVLMLLPMADIIADVETSRRFFERIGSDDKELVTFPDAYHELHNEVEREQAFATLQRWIGDHLQEG